MLDERLVRKINLGSCFALVGSGPSCEVGYPSWRKLAEKAHQHLSAAGKIKDAVSYRRYLEKKQFPELFRQVELDAGGRAELVGIVKQYLVPEAGKSSQIYDCLVKWPFRCYLTTNFDNELSERLKATGRYFQTLRNRKEDFFAVREGVRDVIFKLHSDLDHPDEAVLTSLDYQRLSVAPEGDYFRAKLRQIMEVFDVCIIGHSLTDCDLSLVLQTAKQTASPQHPIYMIAADFSPAEQRDCLEKYNIAVVSYSNSDGEHRQLRRILLVADMYIASRSKGIALPTPPDPEEIEAATVLLIFRRLHDFQTQNAADPSEYIGPLMLQALAKEKRPGLSLDALLQSRPMKTIVTHTAGNTKLAESALKALMANGLVEMSENFYSITEKGGTQVEEVRAHRTLEENQAFGQFLVSLKGLYPKLNAAQEVEAQQLLKQAVVRVFRSRGIAMANAVFAEQSAGPEELAEMFKAVSLAASKFQDGELRAAFMEAAHGFIVDSSDSQKSYLASVSQGFFLYHMIGLDPLCTKVRRDMFKNTVWLCDSSVILPLMAEGSSSHAYAVDLFKRLNAVGARIYTTDKLLEETWQHLDYAVHACQNASFQSSKFLAAAIGKDRQRLNLFVDGFIRMSAEGRIGTWGEYLKRVCPDGCNRARLDDQVARKGLPVLDIEGLVGFQDSDRDKISEYKEKIKTRRVLRGTYKSDHQVEAEAEVFQIIRGLRNRHYFIHGLAEGIDRTYFISLSRVLNMIHPDVVTSWTPEAVYRYLTALPGEATDPELLQQCMLNEYFYAGVSFIEKSRYQKFFGPSISAARTTFEEQKQHYLKEVEEAYRGEFDEAFESTPDLEKPFFVAQMDWRLAEASQRREEAAIKRAVQAEKNVDQLMAEKKIAWKTKEKRQQQQEAAHQRNLKNQDWIKKKLRQAKKKRRKNRK